MKLIEIAAPKFDLAKTLESGQVFHWEKLRDGFIGALRRAIVVILGSVLSGLVAVLVLFWRQHQDSTSGGV